MSDLDRIRRKLHNAFKLGGFNLRMEFCTLLIEKFTENFLDLKDPDVFDQCIRNVSRSFEKQGIHERSIEKEDVLQAIETSINSGCDKYESEFSVIDAFSFPKFRYDLERKRYLPTKPKSTLLSDANSKAQLFIDRYNTILQRTVRNFKNKLDVDEERLELQTVDYLLTLSQATLDKTLVLGSLLQVSEGRYFLEDPTGIVELDLKNAKFHGGLFAEESFVLANGIYEDKRLMVSTLILPPGEDYKDSRLSFGNLNYFGGDSPTPLRDSYTLKKHMDENIHDMMVFFSDVWLDHPNTFEKLEVLFNGLSANPPIAFIFMGNFLSESHGPDSIDLLKKLFKQLGELIKQFAKLKSFSKFVFVPGTMDPCVQHIVPRLPLPQYISEELTRNVPNAIFTTNPCRIQYCTREIVVFRADVLVKIMQATIYKPPKNELESCMARTVISQGHLSPLSLNALTVHWDFDYSLRLYPLPNLIIIGDKSESYQGKYKGCQVVNPGSFCDSGFQFKCYTPYSEEIDDCAL